MGYDLKSVFPLSQVAKRRRMLHWLKRLDFLPRQLILGNIGIVVIYALFYLVVLLHARSIAQRGFLLFEGVFGQA